MKMNQPKLALIACLSDGWAPPLQLAYLATYLRKYGDCQNVRVLDVKHENVIRELKDFQPDLVGISALTPLYSEAVALAREIRTAHPEATLMLGGHHISVVPESLHKIFDLAFLGEAEQTLLEVMNLYAKKGQLEHDSLSQIPGLAWYEADQLRKTEPRQLIEPLDSIPVPDRSFIHPAYINARPNMYCLNWKRVGLGNIFTGRGCPYRCAFCSSPRFWQNVRLHSVERVVEEIAYVCGTYKTNFIHIEDDLFAINKKRVREVTQGLREANLLGKVNFAVQPRMNVIDDEMCRLMKEMGIVLTAFGFESGNDQMLRQLKGSGVSLDIAENAVRMCKKYGFTVQGSVILGSPGETWQQMQDTRNFLDRLHRTGADDIWPFIATPLPGTPFWQYALEHNIVQPYDNNWDLWQLTRPHPQRPRLYDLAIKTEDFDQLYFDIQALLESRRPQPPLSAKIRRLPNTIHRAFLRPKQALNVVKARLRIARKRK